MHGATIKVILSQFGAGNLKMKGNETVNVAIVVLVILSSNLIHYFFIKSIVFLYMFRAILCSPSGGLNCIHTASGS